MALPPILTFRETEDPWDEISLFQYKQRKDDLEDLPVLKGEDSDKISFRLYNNFDQAPDVATAMNVEISTEPTGTPLVDDRWFYIRQTGFGES